MLGPPPYTLQGDSSVGGAWGGLRRRRKRLRAGAVTGVATASGRRYQRRFDWEQARARYQAGEAMTAIAASYGVTREAVRRVVDAAYYAREQARLAARQKTGRCVDCGREINLRSTRCRHCAGIARRTTVRPNTLYCSACDQWKPDSAFYHDARNPARRYHGWMCKTCNNQARRRYR